MFFNEVLNLASTKPFGFMPFYPGPGAGGHCIPVDPFFLSWKADQLGINLKFINNLSFVLLVYKTNPPIQINSIPDRFVALKFSLIRYFESNKLIAGVNDNIGIIKLSSFKDSNFKKQ